MHSKRPADAVRRSRSARVPGSQAKARVTHVQQLAKLREAIQSTPVEPQQSSELVQKQLVALKSKWAALDSAPPKPKSKSTLRKGVRRIGNVTEYDFTIIDAEDSDWDSEDKDGGGVVSAEKVLPREMRYFDTASICVRSGDGGNGCCAFLREKFLAHGGPSGGNGGHGGSVWVVADEGMTSLSKFRNNVHWKADSGAPGSGQSQHGANARDLFVKVPPGTIVRRKGADESARPIAELLEHGAPRPSVSRRRLPPLSSNTVCGSSVRQPC
jgi:hypothetical protein